MNDTLDDIELVTTNDNLLALIKVSESLELGLNARSLTNPMIRMGGDMGEGRAHMSRETRSASMPTGQCDTAVM